MTEQEVYKEYAEKICPYCKGNCEKGIILVKDYNLCTISAKCVDYEKDDSKIEGYKDINYINKHKRYKRKVVSR